MRDLETNARRRLQKKEEAEAQRLKNLVTMYENMKAKDAARIFDRLEMRILIEVASGINPRRMSDILGQMSPEAAERLTVELANRATASDDRGADIGNLPKIEGTPRTERDRFGASYWRGAEEGPGGGTPVRSTTMPSTIATSRLGSAVTDRSIMSVAIAS